MRVFSIPCYSLSCERVSSRFLRFCCHCRYVCTTLSHRKPHVAVATLSHRKPHVAVATLSHKNHMLLSLRFRTKTTCCCRFAFAQKTSVDPSGSSDSHRKRSVGTGNSPSFCRRAILYLIRYINLIDIIVFQQHKSPLHIKWKGLL